MKVGQFFYFDFKLFINLFLVLNQVGKLRLGVSTVETNRDRDRDVVFQTVETDTFLASRSRQKSRNLDF